MDPHPEHRQAGHPVRFEWGLAGARALLPASYVVVVDVLSFTTAVTVAVERGTTVLPYRWHDDSAASYAAARGAVLAVGRRVARQQGGVSLSPASIAAAEGVDRLVLPSPNGSAISFEMADAGAAVVAACLRNAPGVAAWLAPRVAEGASVAVVAAGERWPDDTLRPAAEDLWGAGAVLAGLRAALGGAALSPEAHVAADAFAAVAPGSSGAADSGLDTGLDSGLDSGLEVRLASCASGRELTAAGFADDVRLAAAYDATTSVPLLTPTRREFASTRR